MDHIFSPVTFDTPPDQATIDNATYLEAINYFVEMEKARLFQKKNAPKDQKKKDDTPAGPKNTVLVLPRIEK